MSATWIVVVAVGAATATIKSMGPMLLGGRQLPPRVASIVALLAPALLAALVAINTLGSNHRLAVDARLAGVGGAVVAIKLRASVLVVVVLAAAVTAGIRAVTG